SLPGVTIDGERILEYRGALSLRKLPVSMIVVGAGAIGVEFASFFRTLGVEVTIVEYLASLVPLEDQEVQVELGRAFRKQGMPALADMASGGAVACVERMAGQSPAPLDYDSVPACTFCHPEIGSIGLTEQKAKELGRAVKIGRFPFRALGKARAAGEMDGFV